MKGFQTSWVKRSVTYGALTVGTIGFALTMGAVQSASAVQVPRSAAAKAQIIAQSPTAEEYYERGNALYDQGKFKEAVAAYRKAVQLNPNYLNAYVGLGNALDDSGNPKDAIATYMKAISLKPDEAIIYYNLGITQNRLKDYEAAIVAFRKATELDPSMLGAYINLGNTLDDMSQPEAAIEVYQQVLKRDPDNASAYFNMAIALGRQDKLPESIAAFKKARELYDAAGDKARVDRIDGILRKLEN